MAKKAVIALLLLIAISGIASTTHATATEAASTPRKLVEKFQDQTVVEEVMIRLPQQVRVPNGGICNSPKYDECDPDCLCIIPLIWRPGICACPLAVAAAATQEAPRKMVGKFQDETVEKLIKLPQRVGGGPGSECLSQDSCDPGCYCTVVLPPLPAICICSSAATEEAARKMVGKFQDETLEKLIKLPQRFWL